MGRSALLLVLGLGIAFSYISYNLHKANNNAVSAQMDYFEYSSARNLARTAINLALRSIDRGETEDSYEADFNGGHYRVVVTTSLDTMWMTAVGTYQTQTFTIRVKLLRGTKPFPSINSAVGIRATPVQFDMSGSPSIDGRNHDAEGTTLTGSGDQPGMATMTQTDSMNVKNEGGSRITGSPPVKVDTSTANPLNFVSEYRANADYMYTAGTYSSITWGSSSHPVIVVCETPDTNSTVKFTGNVEGWGVLVVRGNLTISGNFKFHGLVIVYGTDNIVNANAAMGTPEIIGGLILAGAANTSLTLKGTADFMYSSSALQKAKNIGKLRYYSILKWYE